MKGDLTFPQVTDPSATDEKFLWKMENVYEKKNK